jgi:hypothetical protein
LGSKIDKHLQLCGWAHYRATRKNIDSRTQVDEPAECASGGDPLLLYKILHLLFFPLVRILCVLLLELRKNINIVFMRDLWNLFLRSRGCLTNPFRILSLGFGVIDKTAGLISRKFLLKEFLFASAIAIMFWQDVTRSSLCSGVKECETKPVHNFLYPKSSFRIRRTTVLGTFKDSAIILDAIRRSFLTKSATAAMFTSVESILDGHLSLHFLPAPFRLETENIT